MRRGASSWWICPSPCFPIDLGFGEDQGELDSTLPYIFLVSMVDVGLEF